MFKTLFLMIGFAQVIPCYSYDANFDQGVSVSDFIQEMKEQAPKTAVTAQIIPLKNDKPCELHFKTQPLTLDGKIKFARARYEINAQCEPKLASVEYFNAIPAPTPEQEPALQPSKTSSALTQESKKTDLNLFPYLKAFYTCNVSLGTRSGSYENDPGGKQDRMDYRFQRYIASKYRGNQH